MKNYQLWQKTDDRGWIVIQGKGRRIRRKKPSPFYYIIHNKRYERVQDVVDELGYTSARVRYMCEQDHFPDCKQVRR